MAVVVWHQLELLQWFGSAEGTWVDVAHIERRREHECYYLRGMTGLGAKKRNAG
jgi:hypothetical protein